MARRSQCTLRMGQGGGDNLPLMQAGDVVAGRFVIEALAGTGGMGAVYRARDRGSDARVALKVIGEAGSESRFDQEARVLAELDHPAIVRYVAHGRTDDGGAFLVMDWLEGEDLRARLARGATTVAEARTVARRAAEALAAAHAQGVVHRDVKPGNLFLPDGDPAKLVVLDFGVARTRVADAFDTTAVPITRTGMVVGTVGYMSPEQARGSTDVDARSDVFALGCVLFECLTGRPAFVGVNAVAVLAKLLLEEAPRARHLEPGVPAAVDDLVARMLAKDPASRPRDGAAVLRALEITDLQRSSSSGGVGDREQRLVTIVLARGLDRELGRSLIDGELVELADGATLIEFRGADPVTRAAATALALGRTQPRAALAIATGRVASASAYGPIIDRVATLQPKGGIPIDEVSATLLGDRFDVADGVLVGPRRASAAPRTLLGRRTPCVGRDKEIALLEATFRESAGEPISRGLVVTGPAGSGKSRLAHELLARVGGEATVIIARGDPIGAGSALGIVRQLLRGAADVREAEPVDAQHEALRRHLDRFFSSDALARNVEMLGELVGTPTPAPSPQLRAARNDARVLATWLARSFAEWIAAMCDAGPVLCVVEDLHWGDGASVAYLDDALRANESRPLMVLALARPEVHELFPALRSRSNAQEVKLASLTRRAAERLVRDVLPDAPQSAVARIVERADGNAFHIEELIRHVAERGVDSLPETVLALAEARIARLDPEARRWLRVASVFGETMWTDGVEALLAGQGDHDVVRRLVDAELVVPGTAKTFPGEWVFHHGLLREAAYATLADEDRASLHRRAAEWLEGAGERDALVLAEHYERAGERARAAPWLLRAAMRAAEGFNMAAALALAERGVQCGAGGEVLGGLRVIQAMSAAGRGEHAAAARYSKEAYGLLPRGTTERYLAAGFALSSGAYVADFELAPAIVGEMLSTVPRDSPGGAYALALRLVTEILDTVGQPESTMRLFAHADELSAATPDVESRVHRAPGVRADGRPDPPRRRPRRGPPDVGARDAPRGHARRLRADVLQAGHRPAGARGR